MKSFFGKLFGKNLEPRESDQLVNAASSNEPQRQEPELYTKGDVIGGKFEVLGTLGKGGFGVVLLVYCRDTHEVCALKTFRDELLANPTAREAFKKEALLWVNLEEHPFILAARWVEEAFGRLFVSMDYIAPDAEGRVSLADHLAHADGRLDTNQILKWGIEFCMGMEHANSRGIECHRDIKPANILITRDGILKISDFGLASAAEAAWRLRNGHCAMLAALGSDLSFGFSLIETHGRKLCGTPGYIPPEVLRGDSSDRRSDIYSLGLVLWQMAAGSRVPPFLVAYRGDMGGYLLGIYEQQMANCVTRVGGSLESVIERCLQPKPSERYGSFEELRDVLEPIWERRTGKKLEIPKLEEWTVISWNNKGGALDALGRYDEAIECFDKALAIDSQNAKVWVNKGGVLEALGQHEEAIGCFDKALAIDSRDASAWNNMGNVLCALGRHEEANGCFDKALATDPRNARVWDNKGNGLHALRRHEEAIACYDKALAIDRRHGGTWVNKGNVLRALCRHNEAIGCYDKALEMDPLFAPAWYTKGNALNDLGQHEEAIYCHDKALAIDPYSAPAWINKGGALDGLGRHTEAIGCFDKALAIDSRCAAAWYNKGNTLFALRRYEEGIQCCDKALATEPRNANAWYNKGIALCVLGRHGEAIGCYDKALAIDPLNAKGWMGMGAALDAVGRGEEAISSYRKFVQLSPADDVKLIALARQRLQDLTRGQ
ncbi:MAG: tetratricopeptide repeat protein [Verrucomicrobia bacterium]|nr:tetratricopeptide repeat protein [Verrucomicrobiota bacterium]